MSVFRDKEGEFDSGIRKFTIIPVGTLLRVKLGLWLLTRNEGCDGRQSRPKA